MNHSTKGDSKDKGVDVPIHLTPIFIVATDNLKTKTLTKSIQELDEPKEKTQIMEVGSFPQLSEKTLNNIIFGSSSPNSLQSRK